MIRAKDINTNRDIEIEDSILNKVDTVFDEYSVFKFWVVNGKNIKCFAHVYPKDLSDVLMRMPTIGQTEVYYLADDGLMELIYTRRVIQ